MVEPKLRLMNFVPEKGEEIPDSGGVRTGEGFDTRPLFEILKDNKERKDAEFNERFKHRPPKALDDDETEFLENVEMLKIEQERQRVEEEKQELLNFQAQILSRTILAEESKITSVQQQEEAPARNKRPPQARVLPVAVKIRPVPKKAKTEDPVIKLSSREKLEEVCVPLTIPPTEGNNDHSRTGKKATIDSSPVGLLGLGFYGDESDEDED